MKSFSIYFTISFFLFVTTGCVEQPKELTKEQLRAAKPYILKKKPKISHPLEINFEDRIYFLGYDYSPSEPIKPGQTVTVTWYWKCRKKLDDGWLLFTHVEDAKTTPRINADNEGVIRRNYPPGKWKVGEIIKDVQRITIPKDWDSPTITFYVGVWFGPHRLKVKSGPHDMENRARPLVLKTTVKPKEGARNVMEIGRTNEKIVVDGKLDEKAWEEAREFTLLDPVSGGKMFPPTKVKALWDENNLYVAFICEDDNLYSTYRKRDEPLYDQDAVEIFLDPDGDGRNYYEFEVSPSGVIFDSFLKEYRKNDNSWTSSIEVKTVIDGTLNKQEDVDKKWVAEIRIPFSDIKAQKPSDGTKWKANFYRLDVAKAGKKAYAWSPPRSRDFHNLDRFGTIVFKAKISPESKEKPEKAIEQRKPKPALAVPKVKLPSKIGKGVTPAKK